MVKAHFKVLGCGAHSRFQPIKNSKTIKHAFVATRGPTDSIRRFFRLTTHPVSKSVQEENDRVCLVDYWWAWFLGVSARILLLLLVWQLYLVNVEANCKTVTCLFHLLRLKKLSCRIATAFARSRAASIMQYKLNPIFNFKLF